MVALSVNGHTVYILQCMCMCMVLPTLVDLR